MTYYDFDELVGELTPEQRARVEALKEEARAETVAYTLIPSRFGIPMDPTTATNTSTNPNV